MLKMQDWILLTRAIPEEVARQLVPSSEPLIASLLVQGRARNPDQKMEGKCLVRNVQRPEE